MATVPYQSPSIHSLKSLQLAHSKNKKISKRGKGKDDEVVGSSSKGENMGDKSRCGPHALNHAFNSFSLRIIM